jgi:hypothetical protein
VFVVVPPPRGYIVAWSQLLPSRGKKKGNEFKNRPSVTLACKRGGSSSSGSDMVISPTTAKSSRVDFRTILDVDCGVVGVQTIGV